jgi:hypothetical protein|tara:strand:- start:2076 stop:2810 length:735 start_codon:yes stop_codon:yes gene_type:complete
MNKILSILLLMSTPFVFAAATDDNEIMITQVGDTLKLYVDQVGFGNKVGLNDFSSGSGSNMTITGVTLDFNIDMIGNKNLLFGPLVADTSNYAISMTGDSNAIDWNIGSTGSSDDSDINFAMTGDSNTFDIDQGAVASAERLNADLVLIGSSNVFDIDWESDDVTWNFDVTGSSSNFNTLQKDGSQTLNFDFTGDSADVDITQISGTCAASGGGCATPNANVNLNVNSDNAIIQITQKDSGSDS